MRIFPKYSKRTVLTIGILVVLINILVFFGARLWFKNSDEWSEIQNLIVSSPVITSYVGEVKQVSLSLLGLSYGFSGHRADANLDVEVVGSNSTESFNVIANRKHWKWRIVNVSKN